MESIKLEEKDEVKASLVAEHFPNAGLGFFAIVQETPVHKVTTITLNHYQMRVLRDWINASLGDNSRAKLLEQLRTLSGGESDHIEADGLLIEYINDPEITEAFETIEKWYS